MNLPSFEHIASAVIGLCQARCARRPLRGKNGDCHASSRPRLVCCGPGRAGFASAALCLGVAHCSGVEGTARNLQGTALPTLAVAPGEAPARAGCAHVFVLRAVVGAQRRNATYCTSLERIEVVRVVSPSRAVLAGRISPGVDGVSIVALPTLQRVDEFPCFSPHISPLGARVAFERYATPHVRVALRYRGLVAVYDLRRSPQANRAAGGDARLAGRIVNPPEATGDASERWVAAIAWQSETVLRFKLRYDERTRDVSVAFRALR